MLIKNATVNVKPRRTLVKPVEFTHTRDNIPHKKLRAIRFDGKTAKHASFFFLAVFKQNQPL
jgi:hypothetical protein